MHIDEIKPFYKSMGYNSRAAFLRDPNPPDLVLQKMASEDDWFVQKGVLLHPACPIEIRDRFAQSETWYVRFVAFFASKAPEGYFRKAENDPHWNIQRVYKAHLEAFG